jgi:hypothetical protein
MNTLWLGIKMNEAKRSCSISEFARSDCFVPRCSVLHLFYVYKLYFAPFRLHQWWPLAAIFRLELCDLCLKQGVSFLSHTISSSDFTGIRPLDPNSDNASLSSNHVTFFILHSAMTCIIVGVYFTLYNSVTSSLMLSAYFGLDNGPIIFRDEDI